LQSTSELPKEAASVPSASDEEEEDETAEKKIEQCYLKQYIN